MLLYPKHNGEVSEDLELGENGKIINLKMRCVDLDFRKSSYDHPLVQLSMEYLKNYSY
jgi:hypothetical protein